MYKKFIFLLVLILFSSGSSYSKENFYDEAKKLFDKKKYDDSKFLFQREIRTKQAAVDEVATEVSLFFTNGETPF